MATVREQYTQLYQAERIYRQETVSAERNQLASNIRKQVIKGDWTRSAWDAATKSWFESNKESTAWQDKRREINFSYRRRLVWLRRNFPQQATVEAQASEAFNRLRTMFQTAGQLTA